MHPQAVSSLELPDVPESTSSNSYCSNHTASEFYKKPKVFAFCRRLSKLDSQTKANCDGIIQENALGNQLDLKKCALLESKAGLVVVSVGNGESVKMSATRTASAKALLRILQQPERFGVHTVFVVVVGVGVSIKVGFGIGKMVEFHYASRAQGPQWLESRLIVTIGCQEKNYNFASH
jgi:hypothetical protein